MGEFKKRITRDEHLRAFALFTMAHDHHVESGRYGEALNKIIMEIPKKYPGGHTDDLIYGDERHKTETEAIERDRQLLREMLEFEKRRAGPMVARVTVTMAMHPLAQNRIESEILTMLIRDQELDHGAIKDRLIKDGYGSSADPNFGRSVQGTLLSMRSRDLVDLVGMGRWRITKKVTDA